MGQTQENRKDEQKFGLLGFSPRCLQVFNNPWCFLVTATILMFVQGLTIIGLLAIFMPVIERRYNFSSLQIGLIAAANDFAAVILGLAVSHYGNFGNKVKWIGIGGIICSIGLFVFTLPQYIIEKYIPGEVSYDGFLCSPVSTTTANTSISGSCQEGKIAEWYHLALFLVGQFLSGVGAIPMFAFIPAVFQECAREKHMGMFLSIWQAGFFLGPMVAFGVSAPLLSLWVDIDKPEGFENITTKDPRFLGNWWLGFLVGAIIMFIGALCLLCFPEKIKCEKENEIVEKEQENEQKMTAKEKLRQLPAQLKRVMTNRPFLFNCLAINCTLMFLEGLTPFIAKLLYLRYGVPLEKIGRYLVFTSIPPFIIGIIFGGLVTRFFKLETSGSKSAFLCFVLQILCFTGPLGFFIPGCDEMNLAGWKVPYTDSAPSSIQNGVALQSTCNTGCGCNLGIAVPICGSDGITYLGPCQAGCLMPAMDQKSFLNCSCIGAPNTTTGGIATIGHCDQSCKNWLQFLVLMSVISLMFYAQLGPCKYVITRCVLPKDLAFAFGLQYFSTKILAHIPGPIIFGHVIDLNCVIWQKVCDETGYCWVYNVQDTVKTIFNILVILIVLACCFFFLSWFFYKDALFKTLENPVLEDEDDEKL